MPVKKCGPLKLVKRKKENDANKIDENCYSSPTKKIKSVNNLKVMYIIPYTYYIYFVNYRQKMFTNITYSSTVNLNHLNLD